MSTAGQLAPDFTLPESAGGDLRLSTLAGRWVVLWWFPRAGSPGCTVQSRGVDTLSTEFPNVAFVGASFDTPEENQTFCTDTAPQVRFVSDLTGSVAEAYGVKRPPDDPRAELPQRVTFVIDPTGTIHRVLVVSDVWTHADDVRAILTEAGA